MSMMTYAKISVEDWENVTPEMLTAALPDEALAYLNEPAEFHICVACGLGLANNMVELAAKNMMVYELNGYTIISGLCQECYALAIAGHQETIEQIYLSCAVAITEAQVEPPPEFTL